MTRPASVATKLLRGTDRTDRLRGPTAAERLTDVPKAPAGLGSAATAEWGRLAPLLVQAGTLTAADLRGLQLLAETLASCATFAAAVEKDGPLIDAGSGGKKAHPGLAALATARAQARQLLGDFGLLPRGRAGIEAAPASKSKEPDPLDEFTPAGVTPPNTWRSK